MNSSDVLKRLDALGAADVSHPGGTLLRHLRGAHDALEELQAPESHRLAALCHAVYGTDGFAQSLVAPDERDVLIDLIGREAENLVFLYSISDQRLFTQTAAADEVAVPDRHTGARIPISNDTFAGLLAVWLGNELDLLHHADPSWALEGGTGVWAMLERNAEQLPTGGMDALRTAIDAARSTVE